MEKKKIIIFGATGNVGSYVTLYALNFFDKEKYEVVTSGRRKTDFGQNKECLIGLKSAMRIG